ncbi:glycosyltransferase [Mycolicibacterium neoaurum]|nr:hypothetical protein C1S81_13305 [Mycolicibacterium neoaurum]
MATRLDVTVVHTSRGDDATHDDPHLRTVAVSSMNCNAFAGRLVGPRLGELFAAPLLPEITRLVSAGADGIVWSHSYLAAYGVRRVSAPVHVIDFANIESERFRSFALGAGTLKSRSSWLLEHLKATVWEPKTARRADLCLGICEQDMQWLKAHRARAVLARNGLAPAIAVARSPTDGFVLAVANWAYKPNREGMLDFLDRVWRRVRSEVYGARLVIIGADGQCFADAVSDTSVVAPGFVPDLAGWYANSAVVLAPAKSGGGSQLKVAEAWAHGRIVVGPPYLSREQREGLPEGALLATPDLANVVVRTLTDVSARHAVESALAGYVGQHTWGNELGAALNEVCAVVAGGMSDRGLDPL